MNWQASVLNKMGDLETQHPIPGSDTARNLDQMYARWDELKAFIIQPPNQEVEDLCSCGPIESNDPYDMVAICKCCGKPIHEQDLT